MEEENEEREREEEKKNNNSCSFRLSHKIHKPNRPKRTKWMREFHSFINEKNHKLFPVFFRVPGVKERSRTTIFYISLQCIYFCVDFVRYNPKDS